MDIVLHQTTEWKGKDAKHSTSTCEKYVTVTPIVIGSLGRVPQSQIDTMKGRLEKELTPSRRQQN